MKLLVLIVVMWQLPVWGATLKVQPQGGQVEFLAIGKPSFIKIKGKGSAPSGELNVSGKTVNGTITVDVSSLDTGIELRNSHMKEKYLHVDKNPKAELQIKDLVLNTDWNLQSAQVPESEFKGLLTLHGSTQPVTGKFSIGANKEVQAQFKIKLSDYKVDIPTYMGITVADEVEVKVSINDLKENRTQAAN